MPRIIIQPNTINIAVKILQESQFPLTIEQWRKNLTKQIYPQLSEDEIKKKKGVSWNTMRTITQQLINSRVIEPVHTGKMVLYRIRPL
jgi:hypothetical protein